MTALSCQVKNVWYFIFHQRHMSPDGHPRSSGHLEGVKALSAGRHLWPVVGLQGQLQGSGREASELEAIPSSS